MEKMLSVIIPIFNAEKYLEQCLNSILTQPIKNMEVICINDGSTDDSLKILEKKQAADKRIRIINKPNSGYGDSMNWGISVACGDYISIVESDDMVVEGKLALLASYAEQVDADVVKGNYYLFEEKRNITLYENLQGCIYGQVINSSKEEKLFLTAPAIWSGVYRREFLLENEIYFLQSPGSAYQDTSFAFKVWACARRVYLVNEPIIYYRQDNIESSSNNDKKVFEIFNETAEMSAFLRRKGITELLPICMRTKFQGYAWTLDRLSTENKLKFLLKLYYDIRVDFYEGNLVRRYWEEENWNIVFNIIFNLTKVCENILGGQAKDSEQVYSLLKKIEKVYTWEVHNQEDSLNLILKEKNVKVIAQINVDLEGNLIKIENEKTDKLLAADRDILIVLKRGGQDEEEIIKKLSENFMRNYIEIEC
jgi:glycosyltransferase involved in cell wall biosynthesis